MDNTQCSMVTEKKSVEEQISLLIDKLSLEPHVEGGYYRRTYESEQTIETAYGTRLATTSIYYLLPHDHYSKWHRLRSNEKWFHHIGETVLVHTISDAGKLETHRLGNLDVGAQPTVDIPPNTWFSAELEDKATYALVSCMVCPGFDFEDFELADISKLISSYPEHKTLIEKLS